MSDDMERGLRGALRRATDGLSDNPGRYDDVARRVRRRRTGAIAGLTSAVVLLATVGGFALVNQGGDGKNPKTLVAEEPKADELDLTCQAPSGGPGQPKVTSGTPFVQAGAVAARLCPALAKGSPDAVGGDPTLLSQQLRSGVDQLVAKLNQLPKYDPNAMCTMELGPTYDLLLVYSDGTKTTVTFQGYGCGVAKSGAEFRQGAGTLEPLFRDLVKKQEPSGQPTELLCPPPSGGVGEAKPSGDEPLVPTGATTARLCPALKDGHQLYTPLSPRDLTPVLSANVDQLVEKVNQLRGVTGNLACTMELGPTFDLLLGYPDGKTKVVTFEMFGCGYARSGDEFRSGARELGTLFRELAAQQDPAPQPGEPTTCPPPSGGVGTPKNTGASAYLEPGATTAQLCPGIADSEHTADPSLVGRTATSGVDLLVRKLNELPAANPNGPCRSDAGPTYDLVLGYPDGSKTTVTFETFGCGLVKSGANYRSGARDVTEYFRGMISSPDPTKAPVGRLDCPAPSGEPRQATGPGAPGDLVEKGATLAELCPAKKPVPEEPLDDLLHRTLSKDVGKLVDYLNGLPAPAGDPGCNDDLGPLYQLVLGFPDGRTQVVKVQTYGCGPVESDGRFRTGARDFVATFANLLEQQRIASAPSEAPPVDCGKPVWGMNESQWQQYLGFGSLLPYAGKLVPYPAVEAVACRFNKTDVAGFPMEGKRSPIAPAKAEELRGLVNASVATPPNCQLAKGDPVDVLSFADNGGWDYDLAIGRGDCKLVQGKFAAGTASPELLAELDQLLGG
jgi:hypothetical protein